MDRRSFLRHATFAAAAAGTAGHGLLAPPKLGAAPPERFPIGVCDWTLHKTADPTALEVADRLGIDGVMVDFGRPPAEGGAELPLFQQAHQEAYARKLEETEAVISSLAFGVLNGIPLKDKDDPRPHKWVLDSVEVAKKMGQDLVLLAFFGKGDLRDDPAGTDVVVERLKELMPRAEDAGVVYGIESWLKVGPLSEILGRVGSPNLQIYYDTGNMHKVDADIYAELEAIGLERLCEVHAKDYKDLYGKGNIDFPRVRKVLDKIGYSGWIVMEGTEMPLGVEESNRYDADYLRGVFG